MLRWVTLLCIAGCGEPTTFTQCGYRDWSDWCNAHCPQFAATGGACTIDGASCDYGESTVECQSGVWVCTWGNCCGTGASPSQACRPRPDLAVQPDGCKTLLGCLASCPSGDQGCIDDCFARATTQATALLNTLDQCSLHYCVDVNDADSDTPDCAQPDSPVCSDCYQRVISAGGPCLAAYDACLADKPSRALDSNAAPPTASSARRSSSLKVSCTPKK
jgi:hypothetical protein